MKQFFFSLRASYLLFSLLALVFALGSAMASMAEYKGVFKEMTATHLVHCFGPILDHPWVLVWLIALFVVGACLFINTACCTLSQVKVLGKLKNRGRKKRRKSLQMTLIHIAALAVVILHALDILIIERHHPARLYGGQSVVMGGHKLTVGEVLYTADPALITEGEGAKQKITHIPAKDFSMEENVVRVQIQPASPGSTRQELAETRQLKILSPVRVGADYFFLAGFFMDPGTGRTGVEIHHSFNPLAMLFFAVYTILFGLLILRFCTAQMEIRKRIPTTEEVNRHEIY